MGQILILDELTATWRMVWKQRKKQRLVTRRLGGFGKVCKTDDKNLNWGSGIGDGEDRFERDLKGRIVRASQGVGLAYIHSIV